MSGIYEFKCQCGKTFLTGNAFSSHRCKFKRNAGAFIDEDMAKAPKLKLGQQVRYRKKGDQIWTRGVVMTLPRRLTSEYRKGGTGPVQEVDYGVCVGIAASKDAAFVMQIKVKDHEIEVVKEKYVHCYVCGKMRKAKNFVQRTLTEGLLAVDDDGKPTGELIEQFIADPNDPHYYALGCCITCAPKELGEDWDKKEPEP